MRSVTPVPVDSFLAEAVARYSCNRADAPVIPSIRQALGLSDESILGTYDHLRTPFSSRLLVGDERFATLCRRTGARGVLLVLDCTMPPSTRSRGTHSGHTIGLSDFCRSECWLDAVTSDGSALYSYQPSTPLVAPSEDYWSRFCNACLNMLRNQAKIPRQTATRAADLACESARSIVSLYASALSEARAHSENLAQALLRVRAGLRAASGLDPMPGVDVILFSSVRGSIASALSCFVDRFGDSTRFWSLGPLFQRIDESGHLVGRYGYRADTRRFHLHVNGHCGCPLSHEEVCRLVADGSVLPTTRMIYALLHLGGGVAHFGDACNMNRRLGITLGMQRPAVDLTCDGSNSFPVGSVEIERRGHRTSLRNITADLVWQSRESYFRHIHTAVASGKPAFLLSAASAFGQQRRQPACGAVAE
jgi:hypothetical protein